MMGKYQAECDYQLALLNSNKEIESLQAKLAMQAAALDEAMYSNSTDVAMRKYKACLQATQADVDAFMAKKKAEWEKGVKVECWGCEGKLTKIPCDVCGRVGGVR